MKAATQHVVRTWSGPVSGTRVEKVDRFLGIPYAAAPVGELRFAPPRSPEPWRDPLRATEFGPAAPQPTADPTAPFDVIQLLTGAPRLTAAEDNCLTLNVWAPSVGAEPRPVLLWLHGSGWLSGGSGWAGHDAGLLALEENLVVVTANFRLGPFGFLSLPGLAEGNMGFLDAFAALRWVAENIAGFGGDPERVTVGGQSGGGVMSVALMAFPPARGLFRRVFSQSAPLGIPLLSRQEAHEAGRSLLRTVGLRPDDDPRRLRGMDAAELAQGYLRLVRAEHRRQVGSPAPPLHLIGGAAGLPETVFPALRAGAAHADGVDVLIGATGEEFNPFLAVEDPPAEPVSCDAVRTVLEQSLPGIDGDAVYDHYARRRPRAEPLQVLADVGTDLHVRLPGLRLAEIRAERGRPAWVYQMDWRSRLGACHIVDVPFLFNTLPAWAGSPMFRGGDLASAERVGAAFRASVAAFVRTGDPNTAEVPAWEPYTAPSRRTMRFDALTGPVDDLAGPERCFLGAFGLPVEM